MMNAVVGEVARQMMKFLAAALVLTACLTAGAIYGIPLAWATIKPWINALTLP